MEYITIMDEVETLITNDKQMYDCIKAGGEIYSIDEDGRRNLIANGEVGFLRGRPAFPVYPDTAAAQERSEYVAAAKILMGLEE